MYFSVYGDFLINGPNCKIPNMNPFDKEAMKIFDREEFEACSKKQPLTTIEMDKDGKAKLIFHDERKKDFLSWWQDSMEVKSFVCKFNGQLNFCLISVLLSENNSRGPK